MNHRRTDNDGHRHHWSDGNKKRRFFPSFLFFNFNFRIRTIILSDYRPGNDVQGQQGAGRFYTEEIVDATLLLSTTRSDRIGNVNLFGH